MQAAGDTAYVSGNVQHEGLFPTRDAAAVRSVPRAAWAAIDHLSNNYLDLAVHYLREDSTTTFRGVTATTRLEMNQWPLPGYESAMAGHGISRLSLAADFNWGQISVGDVYGQFGSGMLLNLYEQRDVGIDNPLRGAKIAVTPYEGIRLTLIGGKQRRYWNCYSDGAWGWNYSRDAALGADIDLSVSRWAPALQQRGVELTIGGSYLSRYEQQDTILVPMDGKMYMYNLPLWVGAGAVRSELQVGGWDMLLEYAYKANDPTRENDYSYRPGQALLFSLSYSRKGLSVLLQAKHSENMSFRSARQQLGSAGRLNLLPVFTPQHTYALAATYPYVTQYAGGEWAMQAELCYTWARHTAMGGRYGTTMKWSVAHVQGANSKAWTMNTTAEGAYYTDIHMELHKKILSYWTMNAMLMYQSYNQRVIEGEGEMVRAGVAVLDNEWRLTDAVSIRSELQYLYTRQDLGQWFAAGIELELWHQLIFSGEWQYNIDGAAGKQHYYSAMVTYSHDAHRLSAGYVRTNEGFNCAGGVCRYVPEQEGVKLSYDYTW